MSTIEDEESAVIISLPAEHWLSGAQNPSTPPHPGSDFVYLLVGYSIYHGIAETHLEDLLCRTKNESCSREDAN